MSSWLGWAIGHVGIKRYNGKPLLVSGFHEQLTFLLALEQDRFNSSQYGDDASLYSTVAVFWGYIQGKLPM